MRGEIASNDSDQYPHNSKDRSDRGRRRVIRSVARVQQAPAKGGGACAGVADAAKLKWRFRDRESGRIEACAGPEV